MDKKCTKCKAIKPVEMFSINNSRKDKHDDRCKDCTAIYHKEHYAKNKEKVLKHNALYRIQNSEFIKSIQKIYRQTHKKEKSATDKRYNQEHKEQISQYHKEYFKTDIGKINHKKALDNYINKYPEKYKAHTDVGNAVRLGKLPKVSTQVCTVCGNQAQEWHHHNGYSKEHRLDVIAVCISCHKKIERE